MRFALAASNASIFPASLSAVTSPNCGVSTAEEFWAGASLPATALSAALSGRGALSGSRSEVASASLSLRLVLPAVGELERNARSSVALPSLATGTLVFPSDSVPA
jgi:hypothetical protein